MQQLPPRKPPQKQNGRDSDASIYGDVGCRRNEAADGNYDEPLQYIYKQRILTKAHQQPASVFMDLRLKPSKDRIECKKP